MPTGQTSDMEISTLIRKTRIEAGLTQAELGKKLSVGQSAVSQWESPDGTKPQLEHRIKLSVILQIPFEQLLPEVGEVAESLLKDPQVLQLVYNFLQLPPSMRAATLLNVVALRDALATKGTS